jgi:hypothetical protein
MTTTTTDFHHGRTRYHYDFTVCTSADGWSQYDTEQDFSHFGVWVHVERRAIVTFAEGDETRQICDSDAEFAELLKTMADFYGSPPPAFRTIDADGTLTHVYDKEALFGREVPRTKSQDACDHCGEHAPNLIDLDSDLICATCAADIAFVDVLDDEYGFCGLELDPAFFPGLRLDEAGVPLDDD